MTDITLGNNGKATIEAAIESAEGGGGGGSILVAEVSLTDTDIKNLGLQAAFDVVPSPGMGKWLNFVYAVVQVDASDTPYGGIDASANLAIKWGTSPAASVQFTENDGLSSFLGGDGELAVLPLTPGFSYADRSQVEDKALALVMWNNNAGALSGGDPANSGKVKVWYTIEDF